MGRVCERHQEYYEGACRWCVPETEIRIAAFDGFVCGPPTPASNLAAATKLMREGAFDKDEALRLIGYVTAVDKNSGTVTIDSKPPERSGKLLTPCELRAFAETMDYAAEERRFSGAHFTMYRDGKRGAQISAYLETSSARARNGHDWDSDKDRCLRCGHGSTACARYSCESFAGHLLMEKKP
jgi:hypothetical protein